MTSLEDLLPLDQIDSKNIFRFKKEEIDENDGGMTIWQIDGLLVEEEGYYHENISINQFSRDKMKIPDGYEKTVLKQEFIKEFIFNPELALLNPDNEQFKMIQEECEGFNVYFTHDNGGRPFRVMVKNSLVLVYKKSEFHYAIDHGDFEYIQHVSRYENCKQIFIGKSLQSPKTEFSGCTGDEFDGNSILLISNQNQYVYIGDQVYEFEVEEDEEIISYHSPVGNSDVPYPFAVGKKYAYFMLHKKRVPREDYDQQVPENCVDAYNYYYGHAGNEGLCDKSQCPLGLTIVHKRIW